MKLVLLLGFISVVSLLFPGFPPTHDGEYHVIRFYQFDKTLRGGDFYPRWASDLNYGYGIPLFNYVYPWPNYISFLLHLFGISFVDSFKFNMFLAAIIGSAFFYLWVKQFWGKMGGVVSSVFYTFSPYHFVEIYIRGSVGEVWSLAFFPAFLWAYTLFVKSDKKNLYFILSSIFLSLIIFSHNILALMFFFFMLSYILLLLYKEKKTYLILNTLYIILLGLGLSAIFWLPALYETKFVTGLEIFDVTSHFPELYQLLIPSWGSGFSGAGLQNELSFQIGIANLLAVFLSIIIIFLQIKRKDKKAYYSIFFLMWFIFVLFLMLGISKSVWQSVPFMNYFQFPWRLLSIEILFASFLAGSIFGLKLNWAKIPLFLFLIFLSFSLGVGYAKPAHYFQRDDNYYIARSNFIDGTNSPGDVFNTIWFDKNLKKRKNKLIFLKGEGRIKERKIRTSYYFFDIHTDKNSVILINTAYFPGWKVFVDNYESKVRKTQDGLFTFNLPSGSHFVEIKFTNTFIRKLSSIISLIAFALLFIYPLPSLRNKISFVKFNLFDKIKK